MSQDGNSFWDEIEAVVSGQPKKVKEKIETELEVKLVDPPKKAGRPKGSKVKSTMTAEEALTEMEGEGKNPLNFQDVIQKGLEMEMVSDEEKRAETTDPSLERKVQVLWGVFEKLRRILKEVEQEEDEGSVPW